jgi:hypothetical protein
MLPTDRCPEQSSPPFQASAYVRPEDCSVVSMGGPWNLATVPDSNIKWATFQSLFRDSILCAVDIGNTVALGYSASKCSL